ncbi:MAG TPA: zinc-ribbon and DUF3426 domain-containing protein [Burkholderiales bacterium]|nr:zinc-ribbon and DUF3426 domain-containing protein [Burkholderiales bacterium]
MSMVTTCPACGTSFRVMPQQLQAHHGKVRCGHCAHVFDAFQSLAQQSDATAVEVPTEVPPAAASRPPAPVVAPAAPVEPSEPAPQFMMPAEAVTAPRQRGLTFGIVSLLLALIAQAVFFWRGDIAASAPALRPPLEKLCALMRCAVALPQQPQQITIEGSDMRAVDPAAPQFIVLTATLRNHAAIPLGYPALDVVLTNNDDHTVARRIFLPAEYLDGGKDARGGIAPNAETTVRLNLDAGDLGATGFRLDLLPAS